MRLKPNRKLAKRGNAIEKERRKDYEEKKRTRERPKERERGGDGHAAQVSVEKLMMDEPGQ